MDLRLRLLPKARLLWAGLLLRMALIAFAVPFLPASWFVPFVEGWLAAPTLDPWTSHLRLGGSEAAFPYGPVMFVALLPLTALSFAASPVFGIWGSTVVGYGLTVLLAELTCLVLLARLEKGGTVLVCLWLSPAIIVLSYWHGQNDLVPVALLLASLVALRVHNARWAGMALGLAIAAKLSMALAAPIIAVYLYRNARLRQLLLPFLMGLAGPLLLQLMVFAFSPGARAMVLGTPEARKVFLLALDLGGNVKIYILPVAYIFLLFWTWRLRRITFDLAISVLGIVFLMIALLTPATPNWFIWAAPFLALHGARTGRRGVFLVFVLSGLKALSTILQFSGASIPLLGLNANAPIMLKLGLEDGFLVSMLFSTLVALGIFIVVRTWQRGLRSNELYRINRRPLVIGIAGDSGVGKDTLATSIAGIFGQRSVASVSGDDYHNWERARPMWRALTHLNPRANDLERMTGDVLALASGKTVNARHYDHKTGQFIKPSKLTFNEVIIVTGLHALSVSSLRKRYDVAIYLDMDEDLRRFFKIRRDVAERGHTVEKVVREIERRSPDAESFVRPQRAHADIVFALRPVNRKRIADLTQAGEVRLKLSVLLKRNASYETLVRALIGTCGLHVDLNFLDNSEAVELMIEGDVTAEGIEIAAMRLVPNLDELVALQPQWRAGVTGLMQLIVLTEAASAIRTAEILA
jgi:uridine kinase